MTDLFIGTYADAIWQAHLDPGTGELSAARRVASTPAPSFLTMHPAGHTLYAVAETAQGSVSAFGVGEDLVPRGTVGSGGADPCHALVAGAALWVANYGDGVVSVVPLAADGTFAGAATPFPNTGAGPDPDRQTGPHAHSTSVVGDELWAADLGTDEIRRFTEGTAAAPVRLTPGSGPRHLVVTPNGVAVATELADGVTMLVAGQIVAQAPATATAAPAGARNYPSHIALAGALLTVAVRGADVLSTFAIDDGGLTHLADTPTGGRWPRHFAVVGDLVVVANQESAELTALRLDPVTGRAELVGRVPLPAPACVLVA